MIPAGFEESAPGKLTLDEYIRPEGTGSGLKMQRSAFARMKESPKILQKDARPGFRHNQQAWFRKCWFDLFDQRSRHFAHLPILDATRSMDCVSSTEKARNFKCLGFIGSALMASAGGRD